MRKITFVSVFLALFVIFNYSEQSPPIQLASQYYTYHFPKNERMVFLFIGVDYNTKEKEKDTFVEEIEIFEKEIIKSSTGVSKEIVSKSIYGKACVRSSCLEGLDWIVENCTEKDIAVVYIGTHGGIGTGSYAFYGNDKIPVKGSEVREKLSKIKCKLVLIVDTCKAGAMLDSWKDYSSNVCIICSSSNTESTYCWKLTVAIRDALQKADENNDGEIDLGEIRNYIPGRVRELTKLQTVTMSDRFPPIVVGVRN